VKSPETLAKIKITVKLFAMFAEELNHDQVCLELKAGATVTDAVELLFRNYPSLSKWRSHLRYAVNLQFVTADHLLNDGDELAFIPPVSGG
jgi:sulfur-carrier protein